MGGQIDKKPKKRICAGLLAHVDAGKTTLSEALLYLSGSIRNMGRVDNQNAFLDTYALERARGITIFSKQAQITLPGAKITLLDTPGHVDFSAEMERTLQVLDYAVLVISGADGVQGHTQTLWRLLARYHIPVFLFVNKMDQDGTDREALLSELKERLDDACVDFSAPADASFYEEVAVCDERALEHFLETGTVEAGDIRHLIAERKLFPCYFGSALRLFGVEELMRGLVNYSEEEQYPAEFGAKVFKIARDGQGNRLTYLKVTGGSLKVKTVFGDEKVNQIRIYSGEKYETVNEAEAGSICAVTGLLNTRPGQGLGAEASSALPVLEPVLTYRIGLPEGCDAAAMLPKLRQLEEEEPELHIVWDEQLKEIQAQIMGEVQTEILQSLIQERFDVSVSFDSGNILYKETIADCVEGVGHFEPLRHYAEVHLLLEPGEPGSGLEFAASCSEDILDRNWQRLVLTHLEEKEHKGVLTGAPITDMKITLIAGRAHIKHTEGGDFRQATYRAVRQGLKQARSVLLEPYYEFRLEVPEGMVGRAMTDIEKRCGRMNPPVSAGRFMVLTGSAPVVTMRDYQKEVIGYTRGEGRLFCSLKGYEPCHNSEEVIEAAGYDSERDLENPTGSVFCSHGAGFVVSWDKVKDYMHLESAPDERLCRTEAAPKQDADPIEEEDFVGVDEIDAILSRTFYANSRDKTTALRKKYSAGKRVYIAPHPASARPVKKQEPKEAYLLVDGYNIIFAWDELRELAAVSVDGARGRLLDILSNYQGICKCRLIAVFDAYRVQGHPTEILDYHNIHVVYTKEAETADQYIEKFAHENAGKYDVTVATSDGLEQIIILSQGCRLLSAREFKKEIAHAMESLREEYTKDRPSGKNYLFDSLPEDTARALEDIRTGGQNNDG